MVEMEIRELLANFVIPLMKTHLSERGLFDLWQTNLSYHIPSSVLMAKAVLLGLDGKFAELEIVLRAMRDAYRGTSAELAVESRIDLLRNDFGLD